MAVKKAVYQSIVDNTLTRLSTQETAQTLLDNLSIFVNGFDSIGELSDDQREELAEAQERLAELHDTIVVAIGQAAWEKLSADANADPDTVQYHKATVQRLTGNHDMMVRQYLSDSIPTLLAIPANIPTMVNADGIFCLGNKRKASASSDGASRQSFAGIKPGQSLFWLYQKNWYQFVGSEDGITVHDLATRSEVTDSDDLPTSLSGAKKIVTGSWGDNRGFKPTLPEDCDVVAID